jgi:hypothetical protein
MASRVAGGAKRPVGRVVSVRTDGFMEPSRRVCVGARCPALSCCSPFSCAWWPSFQQMLLGREGALARPAATTGLAAASWVCSNLAHRAWAD